MCCLLRGGVSTHSVCDSSVRKICLFPPLINLITYLYRYGLMYIYVILCVIISNYILSLLLLKIFQLWPLGAFSVWPCVLVTCPLLCLISTLWPSSGSSCALPASVLGSPISSRGPGSFYLMVVETKTWALGVLLGRSADV